MTELQKQLAALTDGAYIEQQAKLNPVVPRETFLGVRLPALRKLARELERSPGRDAFLDTLPHTYYDENLLHAILLERMKDYDTCLTRVEAFLPYVDNWAVCDTLRPRVFAKHTEEVLPHVKRWIASPETYTCRFGVDMLMTFYLEDAFLPEYAALPASVTSEEYYVRMMVAWYYATALAKQWDAVIPYLQEHRLPDWTHRKAIRKAVESYRISDAQKAYLKTLR